MGTYAAVNTSARAQRAPAPPPAAITAAGLLCWAAVPARRMAVPRIRLMPVGAKTASTTSGLRFSELAGDLHTGDGLPRRGPARPPARHNPRRPGPPARPA